MTECIATEFDFHPLRRREVIGRFDGGAITSDAVGLLLRELEAKTGLLRRFSDCFTDHRNPDLIEHSVLELVTQRVFGLCLGYEDLNDHDELRHDPLLAVLVGKAEYIVRGENPRFVVTSLSCDAIAAAPLYERRYCARGEMENRIKEQQLFLFADRTSCATMRAKQLRLWFSSVAYVLLQTLRDVGLKGTELERAPARHNQCDTIRLKMLKIGAQVRVTFRKVWIALAECYPWRSDPWRSLFAEVWANLRRLPPRPVPD